MNPMTNVKNILKLSAQELSNNSKSSWHDQYRDSAWVFIGGLPYDLTEGDIICVFSQYGEIANINLIRDKSTGKSKGFGFLCYEDQRSTILAVDNLNGIKILNRTIRVDHVEQYKVPNADTSKLDEVTAQVRHQGCAPALIKRELISKADIVSVKEEPLIDVKQDSKEKHRKEKKAKKEKKQKKKYKKRSSSSESSSSDDRHKRKKKSKHNDFVL